MRNSLFLPSGALALIMYVLTAVAADENSAPVKAFTVCDVEECARKIGGTTEECEAIVKAEVDKGNCGASVRREPGGSLAEQLASGDKLADSGDYAAAYDAYLKAYELARTAPKDIRIRTLGSLAATLSKLGRNEDAARYCRDILALDPRNKWARDLLQQMGKAP